MQQSEQPTFRLATATCSTCEGRDGDQRDCPECGGHGCHVLGCELCHKPIAFDTRTNRRRMDLPDCCSCERLADVDGPLAYPAPLDREAALRRIAEACRTHLSVSDATFVAAVMLKHGERFCEAYNLECYSFIDVTEREAAGILLRLCKRVDSEARTGQS